MWDFLVHYVTDIHKCVVNDDDEHLGTKEIFSIHIDILEYLYLYFCDTVKYHEPGTLPSNVEHFGKCLGPENNIESDL